MDQVSDWISLSLIWAQLVKNLPAVKETQQAVYIPGLGRSLEKEMATHSSILDWEIPRTEEPGGLQSMASQSPYNWVTKHSPGVEVDRKLSWY